MAHGSPIPAQTPIGGPGDPRFVAPPEDGGQSFTVLNPDLSITNTSTPSVGDVLIDPFGQPFGRFNGFFGGDAIVDPLSASEISRLQDLMGQGSDGGLPRGVSRSTSFNVSEVGPVAAQIQRDQLAQEARIAREEQALQQRRIEQETAIAELQSQIEIGRIDISTALTQYDQLLSQQRLRLDASEFAVAPGTEFAPGFAPGGVASQVAVSAGLSPEAGQAPITPVPISTPAPPSITPLAEQPNIQQAFEALQGFGR